MGLFKVTIHEHVIYDQFVEAESQGEAEEIAEYAIAEEDRSGWRLDQMAGWIDIGDIEVVDDDDEEEYA